MTKQTAHMRVVIQRGNKTALYWRADLINLDLYAAPGLSADGWEIFRKSYHETGQTHFYRVDRLMGDNGLKARQKRRYRPAVITAMSGAVASNLLQQDFIAARPNQKWVADISYIWTKEGWLYLAGVMDLYARLLVGWATADRLHKDLAIQALDMALIRRSPSPGVIHHSDRGSQYCSYEYQKKLKSHGLLISMSRKGNCYDNAAMESFFKTIKSELVHQTRLLTRKEAHDMIGLYIDGFYNPKRRHSTLGYLSPMQFEKRAA